MREIERRLEIQQRILEDRLVRVETSRLFDFWKRLAGAVAPLAVRRRARAAERDAAERYAIWLAHEQAGLPSVEQARAVVASWPARPVVSVTGNAGRAGLGDIYPHVEDGLSGDYVCFVAEGYQLSPWAAFYIADCARRNGSDLLYADEDRIVGGRRLQPVFKPAWSPQLLESRSYFGGMLAARRDLLADAGATGGWRDLAVRLAARARHVDRIPRILSHRASGPAAFESPAAPSANGSVLPGPAAAIVCSRNPTLLAQCLNSIRATAHGIGEIVVIAHEERGVNEPLRAAARDRGAAVLSYTGPFNFSAMNNRGAAVAKSPYLVFLNDDLVATARGWLEPLLLQIARPPVGIAGAVLRYPSGKLQHAGIVAGIGEAVGHIGRGASDSHMWPWLLSTRNVSAVTGACLAIPANLFAALGGFDLGFPNNYNDVDLCFRARERGCEVVCAAVPGILHTECQTRRGFVQFEERYRFYRRWGSVLDRPDPFYSPNLASTEEIMLDLASEL